MMSKILHFVLFYVIYWFINQVEGQTARCDYKYKYHWITGYKTTNDSYYTCKLDIEQANYNEKFTRIEGQHGTGHSNADVKYIGNNFNNKLKTFSSIFCQKFPNLEVIQINNAELESVDEDSLSNCKNLDKLLLFGNKIRELPEYLLIRNSKLTYLRIDDNQLTTLPENFFLNQKELGEFWSVRNQISFLQSNIFHPLVKLEVLYLKKNKFQSINPEWFVNLQNLKWLGLHKNHIYEIPSKCFASLKNLKYLWLYENKINVLKSDSFDGLHNLQILSLYSNNISDLPVGVFIILKSLTRLDLNYNKLTTIHSDSFGVHNKLADVYLYDNKINAIDEKVIDNTAVSTLNMRNNICTQLESVTRSEIKPNLKKCFDNYQSRPQPQSQVTLSYPFRNQFSTSNQNICGKFSTGQGNIIGGSYISHGSFPWIAALVTPAGQFFCGGTLISSRKVLTAAHCIQDKRSSKATTASEFLVQLGVHDLNTTFEVGRVIYAVETVNVHPNWNTFTQAFDADIAVLVLESEVTFNNYIQPICMPNSNVASIKNGIVVGFGKSEDETKIHENIPKMLKTPIHSNEDCFFDYPSLVTLSSRRTFCGGSGTGIGVCRGDSGSGLIVNDGTAYYLRGIVSSSLIRGRYGCDVNVYAVFTDVTKYVEWINKISTSRF